MHELTGFSTRFLTFGLQLELVKPPVVIFPETKTQ